MKYIRTKERIYDTYSKGIQLEKNKITNEIEYYYQSCAFSVPFKLEVLSQADTIEELCDEVVIIYPNGSHSNHFCYDYKSFYESIEGQVGNIGDIPYTKENLNEYDIYEIYGAIWTDKGLIYVAKMNDKGELELL